MPLSATALPRITRVTQLAKNLKVPSPNIDGYIRAKLLPPKQLIDRRYGWYTKDLTYHFKDRDDLFDELIRRAHRSRSNRRAPCKADRVRKALGLPVEISPAVTFPPTELASPVLISRQTNGGAVTGDGLPLNVGMFEIMVIDIVIKALTDRRSGYSDKFPR